MGMNCGNLVLLAEYTRRAELGSLLTYGRLCNTLSANDRDKLQKSHGLADTALQEPYTEGIFGLLGARQVTSLDIADHDGCVLLADLMDDFSASEAMRPHLGNFDTVLDYGTSEHVFNFPQALVNAYNLLGENGAYVFDLPVTGWVTHAMYQFTPGYFMAVGASPYFELEHLYFHEKHGDRIYRIEHYNNFSYFRINSRRRISAWGVLRKTRPPGLSGYLDLNRLRVMQVDPRSHNPSGRLSLLGRLRSVQRYSSFSIRGALHRERPSGVASAARPTTPDPTA